MRDRSKLDEFTLAYMVCALWSTNDNSDESGGDPLDDNYDIEDIADETWDRMVEDCRVFQEKYGEIIDAAHVSRSSQYSNRGAAGHDFWLTRNGHGAGFWDGDWRGPVPREWRGTKHPFRKDDVVDNVGDLLTVFAKEFKPVDLYVGDDGEIHGH